MRVLTIVDDLGRGGTQRVAVQTSSYYQRAGLTTAILTRKGSGPREDEARSAGIELFIGEGADQAPTSRATRDAREWKPDIIIAHRTGLPNPSYGDLLRALGAGKKDGPRVIEHTHFGRWDYSEDRHLFDVHLHVSRWCHWKWTRWTRFTRPKPVGVCVPHMVDSDRFHPASPDEAGAFRDQHNIPRDAFLYGYLAQKHPGKWSPVMFNGFRAQAEQDPKAHLVIGGIGEDRTHLFESFPEDIRNRIHVIGFINGDDAMRAAYSAMDCFVLVTGIGETFGLVAAEAMSCATPVVTMANPTKGSGQCEVVGHEIGGLIAAGPGHVSEAMRRIRVDHELRARCAELGRERVRTMYHPDTIGKALVDVIESVHNAPDRASMRRALDSKDGVITRADLDGLMKSWGGMIGSFTPKQRLIQSLILNPLVQRLWIKRQLKLSMRLEQGS